MTKDAAQRRSMRAFYEVIRQWLMNRIGQVKQFYGRPIVWILGNVLNDWHQPDNLLLSQNAANSFIYGGAERHVRRDVRVFGWRETDQALAGEWSEFSAIAIGFGKARILIWVGKGKQPVLEPSILIADVVSYFIWKRKKLKILKNQYIVTSF